MHILFVTHYYEPSSGAAATRLTALAQRLHSFGHQVTVLTTMPHYPKGRIDTAYQGCMTRRENHNGIACIYVWLWTTSSPRVSRKLISQWTFMVTGFLRGLPLARPDVVFIEAQPIFTGIMGRILAVLKRVPYVLNVSDLWPDHLLTTGTLTEQHPVYRVARYIVDSSYRGAAAIIGLSPLWSQKIVDYLGGQSAKVHTILRGCDTKQFRPLTDITVFREKYQLGDKKIISFLGTFATQYDFQVIMDAVAQLQARADTLILMIGTGSQSEYVENRVQATHMPNLHLVDWIPHEEMVLAWNASTVTFWAMHDHDLFTGTVPAKLFEAMACGIPIVAAQEGEIATIFEASSGGVVVPTGDTSALITEIERVLDDDSLRQRLSTHARNYAVNEFDFDVVAHRYEAILQAVISKP
jgi:glycosyltransferase involved in cell wall biosynthesis